MRIINHNYVQETDKINFNFLLSRVFDNSFKKTKKCSGLKKNIRIKTKK